MRSDTLELRVVGLTSVALPPCWCAKGLRCHSGPRAAQRVPGHKLVERPKQQHHKHDSQAHLTSSRRLVSHRQVARLRPLGPCGRCLREKAADGVLEHLQPESVIAGAGAIPPRARISGLEDLERPESEEGRGQPGHDLQSETRHRFRTSNARTNASKRAQGYVCRSANQREEERNQVKEKSKPIFCAGTLGRCRAQATSTCLSLD